MIKPSEVSEYTDCYFTKSREALEYNGANPCCIWQVFQKKQAVFCGIEFILPFLNSAMAVFSLRDGDAVEPFEPALIIKAGAADFVEFESVYLGIIARMTKIATNVRAAVTAANGKPVLFFPARFDVPDTQVYDGFAAAVGGAAGCATQKQTEGFNRYTGKTTKPSGTMPHALIAAYKGDTVEAALAFAYSRPDEDVWVLVDFHNDCAKTAIEVFEAFKARGIESRLKGIRLDTSEKLIDKGIEDDVMGKFDGLKAGQFNGVCPKLVFHVRKELDAAGATAVKIAVSGGFTPAKIELFEQMGVPADVYAVGEGFLLGSTAFTSDIVAYMDGNRLVPCGKVGRELKVSNRLVQYVIGKAVSA